MKSKKSIINILYYSTTHSNFQPATVIVRETTLNVHIHVVVPMLRTFVEVGCMRHVM